MVMRAEIWPLLPIFLVQVAALLSGSPSSRSRGQLLLPGRKGRRGWR